MAKETLCIDSDICVDFLRKRGEGFSLLSQAFMKYNLCITAITAFELHLGHIKMNRVEAEIIGFLSQFKILPFDYSASRSAAAIQAELEKKGRSIGIPDTLIAAICLTNTIPLLTMNKRHFSRVAGLKLI